MKRLIFALVAVLAVGSVIFASGGGVSKTSAAVNITGEWDLTFAFNGGGTCDWVISQTGGALTITGPCDFSGPVNLTGTINETTGLFSAAGSTAFLCGANLTINGTATNDSIVGNFNCAGTTGTFTGARVIVDSDGDGIDDANDLCPAEDSTGFDADNDGCIDRITDLGAFFDTLFEEGAIDSRMHNSLHAKIDAAVAASTRENVCAAVSVLDALKNQIEAQTGKKVSEDAGALLLAYITNVQNYMLIVTGVESC